MRSADAAEKTTRRHRALLQPHKSELLGLLAETQEQELRWHLAALISRLELNARERKIVISSLQSYLQDRSSIVRTFAFAGTRRHSEAGARYSIERDRYSAGSRSHRHACYESAQPQITGRVRTRLAAILKPLVKRSWLQFSRWTFRRTRERKWRLRNAVGGADRKYVRGPWRREIL